MQVPCVSPTSILLDIARLGSAGAVKARLRSTGLDGSGLQSPPCLLQDMCTAGRSHGVYSLNEVVVRKARHLDEVADALNVLTELVTLTMIVGMVRGSGKRLAEGGRGN